MEINESIVGEYVITVYVNLVHESLDLKRLGRVENLLLDGRPDTKGPFLRRSDLGRKDVTRRNKNKNK